MSQVALPEIVLLLITFNRYETLKKTLSALKEFMAYPQDKLHVLVSDDSTGGNYLNNLKKLKDFKDWGINGLQTLSTPERFGWGRHVNYALSWIAENIPSAKYVLQIEDDYVLKVPLDLQVGAALMEAKPDIGMLRYRGTAGGHAIYHQFEADISPWLPDYAYGVADVMGRIPYLQIDSASQYIYSMYSNGAHLKRLGQSGWHAHYGMYPEGLKLGHTEESYAIWTKQLMTAPKAPAIAILPEWIGMYWEHIGASWQGSAEDIGK